MIPFEEVERAVALGIARGVEPLILGTLKQLAFQDEVLSEIIERLASVENTLAAAERRERGPTHG